MSEPRVRFIPSILRTRPPPRRVTMGELFTPRPGGKVVFPGGPGEALLPDLDGGEGGDDCAICLGPMGCTFRVITPCDHIFHVNCFNKLINTQCPLCRAKLC